MGPSEIMKSGVLSPAEDRERLMGILDGLASESEAEPSTEDIQFLRTLLNDTLNSSTDEQVLQFFKGNITFFRDLVEKVGAVETQSSLAERGGVNPEPAAITPSFPSKEPVVTGRSDSSEIIDKPITPTFIEIRELYEKYFADGRDSFTNEQRREIVISKILPKVNIRRGPATALLRKWGILQEFTPSELAQISEMFTTYPELDRALTTRAEYLNNKTRLNLLERLIEAPEHLDADSILSLMSDSDRKVATDDDQELEVAYADLLRKLSDKNVLTALAKGGKYKEAVALMFHERLSNDEDREAAAPQFRIEVFKQLKEMFTPSISLINDHSFFAPKGSKIPDPKALAANEHFKTFALEYLRYTAEVNNEVEPEEVILNEMVEWIEFSSSRECTIENVPSKITHPRIDQARAFVITIYSALSAVLLILGPKAGILFLPLIIPLLRRAQNEVRHTTWWHLPIEHCPEEYRHRKGLGFLPFSELKLALVGLQIGQRSRRIEKVDPFLETFFKHLKIPVTTLKTALDILGESAEFDFLSVITTYLRNPSVRNSDQDVKESLEDALQYLLPEQFLTTGLRLALATTDHQALNLLAQNEKWLIRTVARLKLK